MEEWKEKKGDFEIIVEKMQSRLAFWKIKLLIKARRLMLANLVLNAIPTS